ncbi:MAG: NAD-dependent epimerase/dehydratase family protein [Salinivirgaceae bacterium]|nr:NAD-dependent epimerase/dehydratase family protein [Salinivirgaceae bacterium]MDY0281054.1 NAD-dependent epimerase/dehydratase family protein [Salinivirgaceae bacterium]
MKINKILVTGGAGFIGSAMALKLMEDEENYVVIVDDLSTGDLGKIPPLDFRPKRWKFVKCNVNNYRDIAEIMLAYKFDYVFHYAAVVGVQRTQECPVSVLNDIEGIKNILGLAKNTGVKRVFFSSSSEIYGEPVEIPQHVYTTPLNSRLPYAIVKNVGEAFLRSYHQEYELNYTIFRFFNTYGPKQAKDFVISKFINKALHNEDLTIFGDGLQTRTFCYIDDNIETCYKIFKNSLLVNDVINIGGNIEVPIIELAKLIIKKTNSKSKIVHLPPLKDGDMKRRKPEISPMIEIMDKPLISIEDGIDKVLTQGLFEN